MSNRTLCCPACGNKKHFSVVESVLYDARIHPEISDEGTVEYDKDALSDEPRWDSGEPVRSNSGWLLIHCYTCGEEWYDSYVVGTTE